MREYEVITRRNVGAARRAMSLCRVTVVEHAATLATTSPVILRAQVRSRVVMEDEIVTLRIVAAPCRTSPGIVGEAGEKHAMALAAIAPIFLRVSRGFWIGVEGQFKVEPLREVAAAAGANSLLGKSVEE